MTQLKRWDSGIRQLETCEPEIAYSAGGLVTMRYYIVVGTAIDTVPIGSTDSWADSDEFQVQFIYITA